MSRQEAFLQMLTPGKNDWAVRDVLPGELSVVTNTDAAEMLKGYIEGPVTYEQLLDWANLLLFNDAFSFEDDDLRDCLDRIEESDEPGSELTSEEVVDMIKELV